MFYHFTARAPWPTVSANGLLDIRLVTSRNGVNLSYTESRNGRSPFVPLGINDCAASTPGVRGGWCDPRGTEEQHTSFDTSAMYMASGYLPSHDGHALHLYSSGQPNTHGQWEPGTATGGGNSWGQNTGVRLLQLRKDGFVSVDAPYLFSKNRSALPSITTTELTVPSHCIAPRRIPLPGPQPPTSNLTCSYELPGSRCDAPSGSFGWHNVTCSSTADCAKLCGSCHCHGSDAVCRAHSDGHKYCDTGKPGGLLCHSNLPSPHVNNTKLVGGVELLLNVETSVAGASSVPVADVYSRLHFRFTAVLRSVTHRLFLFRSLSLQVLRSWRCCTRARWWLEWVSITRIRSKEARCAPLRLGVTERSARCRSLRVKEYSCA